MTIIADKEVGLCQVWVRQEWNDTKLKWNPKEYGGVERLYVPVRA